MSAARTEIMPWQDRCDFCYQLHGAVVWEYPCQDFSITRAGLLLESTGAWETCVACHALIVAEAWDGLFTRCLDSFQQRHPEESRDHQVQMTVQAYIRELHQEFRTHRTGHAVSSVRIMSPEVPQ